MGAAVVPSPPTTTPTWQLQVQEAPMHQGFERVKSSSMGRQCACWMPVIYHLQSKSIQQTPGTRQPVLEDGSCVCKGNHQCAPERACTHNTTHHGQWNVLYQRGKFHISCGFGWRQTRLLSLHPRSLPYPSQPHTPVMIMSIPTMAVLDVRHMSIVATVCCTVNPAAGADTAIADAIEERNNKPTSCTWAYTTCM